MPAVAVITLIGVALLVGVLAAYLIRVALILHHVVGRLDVVLGAVGAVNEEAAPIGQVADAINADLGAARRAVEEAADRSPDESSRIRAM
ncbi:MAG: hypothetical protein ACR2JH_09185 [Solirubrobacteraceae bacterium]